MNILIIDNNIDPEWWGASGLLRMAKLGQGATISVRRGPQDDLPKLPDAYDRILISGSKTSAMEDAPWIGNLHRFILKAVELSKPLLGVCYGHQALVRALGGKERIRRAKEAEYGWTKIELTSSASPLFKEIPQEFYSFSAHFEEVASLPSGMKHLARSGDCEIQACQVEGKPIYGIQFHPEKDIQDALKVFASRKKLGTPKRLLHPNASEKLYDPKTSEKLFRNFLGPGI